MKIKIELFLKSKGKVPPVDVCMPALIPQRVLVLLPVVVFCAPLQCYQCDLAYFQTIIDLSDVR